jgi:hypothetical protein
MWECSLARNANLAQRITLHHNLAFGDGDRSLFHVAILGLPPVIMLNYDAVAAFDFIHALCILDGVYLIYDTITARHNAPCGSGNYEHAPIKKRRITKTKIRTFVPVIG